MAVLQCRIRKIRLPNLAGDESSDDDSVNCSEISAVTWFRIFFGFLKIENFVFFTPPYCPEETSATTEEPSGKTRVLPKSRVGAVTLKAPQFPDIPHE